MPETGDAQPQAQKPVAAALQAKLNQGMALHRQGKLADAERCYGEVLQRQPNHFGALHLLGVIARQTRRTERAVELIKRAIGLNPNVAEAHNNLGNALRDLKRPAEGLASYDKAIALKPDFAEAHNNRGNALRDLKRPAEALASYERAIALKPDYSEAHNSRGNALRDLKRPVEALASYDKAIALKPDFAEAHNNRGNALNALNRPEAATASCDNAIALNPDYANAYNNRGNALKDLKRPEEAIASFDKAIALKPDFAEAHNNRGNALKELKHPEEAIASFDKAIALKPDFAEAHNNRGNALKELKHSEEALASYDKAIALKPDFAEAHFNRGNELMDLKRPEEALASYDRAIALKPDYAVAHSNRGKALRDLKRPAEALASYDKAIALKPDFAAAHFNRGNALMEIKRLEEAVASYDKAIALEPDYAWAHYNRGIALRDLKRPAKALASYDKAIALKPDVPEAHYNRGVALRDLKRPEESLASYDKAIALKPDVAEAHNNRGNALKDLKRPEEALASYDRAIALKPDFPEAHSNRGNVLHDLKRYDEAFAAYDAALAFKPDCAEAWLGRGHILHRLKRHEEAASAYAQVLAIDSQYPFVKGMFLYERMLSCDWKGIEDLIAEIDGDVASGRRSTEPFGYQAIAHSAQDFKRCAEIFAADKFPRLQTPLWRDERYDNSKIRVGYVSAEFRDHVTSRLITELFELHDKNRFELFAFDNGWDDGNELRGRINKAFNTIVDISRFDDLQVAKVIKQRQIDILVNLNGYFGAHRTRVFSYKPSPIQVSYLGFSATMGTDYIDYIIADRYIIPPEHETFYTESVVYLPNTYQVNDTKRQIALRTPARAELKLPDTGFIFCCFNNNFKITPEIFDVWMRLLNKVDDSVLWLRDSNPAVSRNLREAAKYRKIAPERLVFSLFTEEYPDYLARYRVANLFLDTLPFNAGGTASDALWAGLPLLTCSGQTYTARMAGSLLKAIGLPELITTTLEAYEQMAFDLATHPEKLAAVKHKLAENRLTTPLFDTKLFTKHIETAYAAMYERYQAGLPPDHIAIPN